MRLIRHFACDKTEQSQIVEMHGFRDWAHFAQSDSVFSENSELYGQ